MYDASPNLASVDVIDQLSSLEARRAHLESLPAEGFTEQQHAEVIDQILAVGLPVSNFRTLAHKPNERGRENVLGSWGNGEFSVYDLLDRQLREKRLGTIAHESAHANSPMRSANAHLYGSEGRRQDIADFVEHAATQSLATGKYLNGYHKWLAERIGERDTKDSISPQKFAEETMAILAELRLSNPKKLAQVEAAQHAEIARHPERYESLGEPVRFMSSPDSTEPSGIDKMLVSLIDGVEDVHDLNAHVDKIKLDIYGDSSIKALEQRRQSVWLSPEVVEWLARVTLDLDNFTRHPTTVQ